MIYNLFTPEATVLANGEYPVNEHPLHMLYKAPYVACCDGSADTFIRLGHTPDIIIGDGDSLSLENKIRYNDILHQISEQESNDQTKAVNYLIEKGYRRIAIVGATGKREDHTLGNVSLLIDYMHKGVEVRTYTDHGVFIPINGTQKIATRPGQQISIFNFSASGLKAEGLMYPLRDFTSWWQGTLNEALTTSFTIHCTGDILIYLAY